MSPTDAKTASQAVDLEAENARADARGIVFLAVMAVAGALTIAATLSVGTPAGAGAKPTSPAAPVTAAPVSAAR